MTQNESGGIDALTAETQQILTQAQRQIEFAAVHVIARLSIGNVKVLRGGTQLLSQFSCAGISLTRFRRGETPDGLQHRAKCAGKFELESLSFGGIGQ